MHPELPTLPRRCMLVGAVLVSVAMTGCGDASTDADTGTAGDTTSEARPPASDPGGPTEGPGSAFCLRVADLEENDPFAGAQLDATDSDAMRAAVALFEELGGIAPDELRDEFRLFAEALTMVAEAMADVDPDDPDSARAALGRVDGDVLARLDPATDRVARYAADVCGIELSVS